MPKQMRYAIKQKLTSAIVEQQKAADKLTEVGLLFEKDHPDIYQTFCDIIAAQVQLKEMVQQVSNDI